MKLLFASIFTITILASFVFALILLILLYIGHINIWIAIALTIGINFVLWIIGPLITDWITRVFYHGKYLSKSEVEISYPYVAKIINEISTQHKFRFPKVGIISDKNPTAFSYGSARFNARIVLTEGIFHFLTPQEVESVVAHELGHIVNRDFIVMMIASTLVQIVYEIYAVLIRAKGRKSGNIKAIALIAYALYLVGTYVLLYLSRTREYLADRFSAEYTNPEDLANSLIKIAYGIITTVEDNQDKHLLHSTRQLGIIDVEHAKQIGAVSYTTNHNHEILAEVMVFDKVSPWAKIVELNSTHPLTGKRIEYLSRISQSLKKPFTFDVDAAVKRLNVDIPKLYHDFLIGFLIYLSPVLIGIILFLFAPLYYVPLGIALGMLIQITYQYPFNKVIETTILDQMRNPYASPIKGIPVSLYGTVVGRGIPGYMFSEDMMYQDKTGLVLLLYNSAFGFIGNLFFALNKIKTLFDKPIRAEGWFFRGMGSIVALKYIKTDKEKVRSHPILWKVFIVCILLIISLGIIFHEGIANFSMKSFFHF